MTPIRVLVILLILLLGATLAVGTLGPPPPQLSDQDYIAIARGHPEVFRAGTPRQISVQRGDPVVVVFVFDRETYHVRIDPRSQQVTDARRSQP